MSQLAIDANGKGIQALRPTSTEKISSTGTASSSSAISDDINVVRIIADAAIHYDVEATATSSDVYLPADQIEYIRVIPGETISFIGTANVYVTEMG